MSAIKVPPTLYRQGTLQSAEDGSMRLSISSDEPYKRFDWWNGKEYWEVLDHRSGGVDLTRLENGAALLFNHDRNIMLGTLSNPTCAGGRCYVDAKMSQAPDCESYRIKVAEGILKDTSIGYTIAEEGEKIGERDGIPVLRFKFSIHEASLVTIPADITVGVGRDAAKPNDEPREVKILGEGLDSETQKEHTRRMPENNEPNLVPKINVNEERSQAVAEERKRVADIQALANHFATNGLGGRKIDTSELAGQFIAQGKTEREFQDAVVRGNFPEAKTVITTTPELGMGERDKRNFSLVRAMRNLSQSRPLDGLEREASDAHAKLLGKEVDGLGFFIPEDIMRGPAVRDYNPERNAQLRTLFAGTYSAAGALIADDLSAFSLIELLRNQMLVIKMGARSLSGLKGNVPIPRQTGGATASWLAEDATVSASNQAVGQLNLTPHRLAAATAYTQQLLTQSSIDVENFVRQDLMAVIAIARDLAAINGSGVNGEPLGIINHTTTQLSTQVTLASVESLTYAKAVQFETNVSLNNANTGKLGYMASIGAKGNAKLLAEIQSTNSNPVWKGDMVNGYPAFATNQIPTANGVIFGNWDDLILASWGDTSVIVDPFSLSMANQIRIVMNMSCDNGLRHTKSFAKGVL